MPNIRSPMQPTIALHMVGRNAHSAIRRAYCAAVVQPARASGCAMLSAGAGVGLCKREERQIRDGQIVPALNVAVFFGMPIASLALLRANRLLPDTLAERGAAEAWCFSVA